MCASLLHSKDSHRCIEHSTDAIVRFVVSTSSRRRERLWFMVMWTFDPSELLPTAHYRRDRTMSNMFAIGHLRHMAAQVSHTGSWTLSSSLCPIHIASGAPLWCAMTASKKRSEVSLFRAQVYKLRIVQHSTTQNYQTASQEEQRKHNTIDPWPWGNPTSWRESHHWGGTHRWRRLYRPDIYWYRGSINGLLLYQTHDNL